MLRTVLAGEDCPLEKVRNTPFNPADVGRDEMRRRQHAPGAIIDIPSDGADAPDD
jgi:hypothetical protein